MNHTNWWTRLSRQEERQEMEEPWVLISPTMLRVAVSVYLLWVIREITAGILGGKVSGASAILLMVACMALFGGVFWLFASKWIRFRNRLRQKRDHGQAQTGPH